MLAVPRRHVDVHAGLHSGALYFQACTQKTLNLTRPSKQRPRAQPALMLARCAETGLMGMIVAGTCSRRVR